MKERFRKLLGPTDHGAYEPPPGLASRTIARVAALCRSRSWGRPYPAGASNPVAPFSPYCGRANVLIAAALVIAVLGIVLPGLTAVRHQQEVFVTQNQFRLVHQELTSHAEASGRTVVEFDWDQLPSDVLRQVMPDSVTRIGEEPVSPDPFQDDYQPLLMSGPHRPPHPRPVLYIGGHVTLTTAPHAWVAEDEPGWAGVAD